MYYRFNARSKYRITQLVVALFKQSLAQQTLIPALGNAIASLPLSGILLLLCGLLACYTLSK